MREDGGGSARSPTTRCAIARASSRRHRVGLIVIDGSLGRNVVARLVLVLVDEGLVLAGGHADGVALAAGRRGRALGERRNCDPPRRGFEEYL